MHKRVPDTLFVTPFFDTPFVTPFFVGKKVTIKQKAPLNSEELVRLDVTEFMTLRLRYTLGKVERVNYVVIKLYL